MWSVWQMHNYKLNNSLILCVLYSDHMEVINHLNSSEESHFLEGKQQMTSCNLDFIPAPMFGHKQKKEKARPKSHNKQIILNSHF